MGINLVDLLPPKKPVPLPWGGALEVGGLDLDQVALLMSENGDNLLEAFVGEVVDYKALVKSSPKLVAQIICMASGTEGQEDVARKFPLQTQVEMLTAIWKETVPDVKKLVDLLSTAAARLNEGKTAATSALQSS